MLQVLFDIKQKYGIPSGTMRSAISRGLVPAEKRGGILMVDDESEAFRAFKQSYRPRSVRDPSLSHKSFTEESETFPKIFSS